MANTIPPMLSSTPPPMDDDAMDENDDEDFGDYSTANQSYNSAEPSDPIYNAAWEDGTLEYVVKCEDFSYTPENKVSRLILDEATASSERVAMSGRDNCADNVVTSPMVEDRNLACQSEDLNTTQLQSNPLSEGISQTFRTSSSLIGLQQMVSETVSEVVSASDCPDPMSRPQSVSPNVMCFVEGSPECAGGVSSVCSGPGISSSAPDNTFTTDYSCASDGNGCQDQLSVGVGITSGSEEREESGADVAQNGGSEDREESGADVAQISGPEEREESGAGVAQNGGPEEREESGAGVAQNGGSEDREESGADVAQNDDLNSECNIFQGFDKFEEFATFQDNEVVTKCVVVTEEGQNQAENEHENAVSLTDSEFGFPSDDEDEFCDFASSSVPLGLVAASVRETSVRETNVRETSALSPTALPLASPDVDCDCFDTFQTASPPTSRVEDTNQVSAAEGESVVALVFPPHETSGVPVFTPGGSEDTTVWTSLRDVDASNALTYQWINSTANKMLLAALGIDTRNILFGPKWGVNVPRFAANLSVSPLQPVPAALTVASDVTHPTTHATLQLTAAHSEVVVPDAQFDWTSSGLVNPLDCFERVDRSAPAQEQRTINGDLWLSSVDTEEGISADAARFIDQLSDVSFVRFKTLVMPPYRAMLLQS